LHTRPLRARELAENREYLALFIIAQSPAQATACLLALPDLTQQKFLMNLNFPQIPALVSYCATASLLRRSAFSNISRCHRRPMRSSVSARPLHVTTGPRLSSDTAAGPSLCSHATIRLTLLPVCYDRSLAFSCMLRPVLRFPRIPRPALRFFSYLTTNPSLSLSRRTPRNRPNRQPG